MKDLTTTLVFLVQDDQVLLGMKKRGFGVGRYNGIGGKVEPNESIEQALIRESIEEIGVTPIKFEKIAKITFDEFFKGKPTTLHMHVFIVSLWAGTPTESAEMAPSWFMTNNLPFDQMWPDDPFWLPQILTGTKVIAEFKLDNNDKIINYNVANVTSLDNAS